MSDWQLAFGEIDDDYLTGISNKGIVKRAYKDLETIPCMAAGQNLQEAAAKQLQDMAFAAQEVLELTVGEETVQIRLPLGESTCSCPSRSICRHVVQGILAMKAAFAASEAVENKTAPTANETVEAEKEAATSETMQGSTAATSETVEYKPAAVNETVEGRTGTTNETIEGSTEASTNEAVENKTAVTMIEKVTQQIADYPLVKLCKSLGTRRIQEVIGAAKTGRKPQITYSSVVTVQPIAKSMTVKLLFPLEHATCTCHKKEFCVHKAEAVLWCKLESGQLGIQDLEQTEGTAADYDMEQVHEAASQMRTVLEELFDTGLSRTADDVTERMERLAVISHNAKLANFESDWRRMQDSYQKYMKRVATLGIPNLMRQITRLYRNVERLAQAQNALEVSALAGVFRSEYTPALDLDLVGIALEHFVSKSGYEGDTVYFLEETTKRWYTYTQARPVFYEKEQSLYYYGGQRYTQETPWGLPVPFRELAACQFHLEHAKSDSRGRLSSSKETKGRLIRERDSKNPLTEQLLGKWYYRDFAQLFQEMFCAAREAGAEEADHSSEEGDAQTKLVILRPSSCDPAVFSDTEQKLRMKLYDEAGKAVVIEITYSKDEAEGIRYLEKITDENLPCFFGKIYLQDGRIKLYPIAVFGKRELQETDI
ncbi:MAG: SWIM zinc finger family protein [Lachnospiraceae bacterium]|jgi:hypothetical protein|nr:hypothetical protein C804_02821 [Lachnospiraceae bacterium A4]